ncbi:MAG: hypothetical protein P0S96_04390 [Simkaniaceae bacterium]|nr:hypothetical protein [Candidatus Sacchlamyda saccharinae]
MKFQKLEALEKHFKEAYPEHLSSIYVVICSADSERKKILSSLTQKLKADCDFKKCPLLKDAIEHLGGASLFSGKVAALFDGVDQLVKSEGDLLKQYVQSPNPQGYLLLGASSAKSITELYKVGKKEMVILDLSKEKPWEEKARLQQWIVQVIHHNKKKIAPDAVEALLSRLPPDRLLLQQEIDKLLCFVGDREQITRTDIETICSTSQELNVFHLARDLVWNKVGQVPLISDLSLLLPLVGGLRAQLEMGLKMSALLKKGTSPDAISEAFPRLWPKALQEALSGTKQKGEAFFKKGLIALFDFELGLKTSKSKPETLFTRFCGEIHE